MKINNQLLIFASALLFTATLSAQITIDLENISQIQTHINDPNDPFDDVTFLVDDGFLMKVEGFYEFNDPNFSGNMTGVWLFPATLLLDLTNHCFDVDNVDVEVQDCCNAGCTVANVINSIGDTLAMLPNAAVCPAFNEVLSFTNPNNLSVDTVAVSSFEGFLDDIVLTISNITCSTVYYVTPFATGTYEHCDDGIWTNSTVPVGNNVTLRTKEEILLEPYFTVELGAEFFAEVDQGCQ